MPCRSGCVVSERSMDEQRPYSYSGRAQNVSEHNTIPLPLANRSRWGVWAFTFYWVISGICLSGVTIGSTLLAYGISPGQAVACVVAAGIITGLSSVACGWYVLDCCLCAIADELRQAGNETSCWLHSLGSFLIWHERRVRRCHNPSILLRLLVRSASLSRRGLYGSRNWCNMASVLDLAELHSRVRARYWAALDRTIRLVLDVLCLRIHQSRKTGQAIHWLCDCVPRYLYRANHLGCFSSWRRREVVVDSKHISE